jgi:RHS repeat-associated protein
VTIEGIRSRRTANRAAIDRRDERGGNTPSHLTLAYTSGRLTSITDWAAPARVVSYQYDGSGRLWKVTDREGKTTTHTYDGSTHRLTTITDARGNVTLTNTYDAQGRVATQKDARGLVTGDATTYAYVVNVDGTRETTISAPPTSFEPSFSPSLTDSYDANGWLIERVTRPSSTETLTQSFTYDADGDRTSATDARGNRTDFCYDVDYAGATIAGSDGNLTRRMDAAPTTGADRPVALIAYDAKDNVIQTVAPEGVPSGSTVTCGSDLSAINTAYASDFSYDAAGEALLASTTRSTDPDLGLRTAVTKYEYGDAANRGLITRLIPPRGNTGPSPDYTYATTFSYYTTGSNAGLLKDRTDPLGNRTSFAYDAVGRLTSIVDPLGNSTGGIPSEHTTTISYDKEDRLRFRTVPAPVAGGAGLSEETRYDAAGNPIVRIDANGQVTTLAFDERNSLASVTESAQPWTDPAAPPAAIIVTEYDHDAGGNVTRITRAAGDSQHERVSDYAYDGRGLLRTETQYPNWPSTAGPLVTAVTYNPNGSRLTATDPLGQTTTFAYDALNRLTGIDYADAATPDVAYAYDANGNRTSMTDGTGTTTYLVDEAGRIESVTTAGPTTVGYRYDLDGNRTELIYPDATAVTYSWNKGGQLASLLDWASRSASYTYAPDGLVGTATNPDGSVATYTYDNARRLVDILHTGPSGAVLDRFAYTLDAAGNITDVANGSLVPQFARPDGLVSSNGSWSGTYASIDEPTANDADFLASPSGPTTSNYYEVSLSDVGEPHVLTGITVRYRYAKSGNNSGKVTNLTVELRQGATVIALQSHSNIPGVTGSGWQAGSIALTSIQANAISNFSDLRLRFRPSSSGGGQSRSAQISWAEIELASEGDPATLISYGYDRLYRLTDVDDVSGAASYTYDPVGNRLTASATAFTYDRADRITAAGAASVNVDANGNLTANGADTFAFDEANRLTGATVDGVTEAYEYDGDGTRVSRQVGSDPAIGYTSDIAGGLPRIIDDGSRKYVYGLGLAYAVSGSAIEVYHTDHLGSVRTLTDGAGAVVATYGTDAWGVQTQSSGSSTQPFEFTGEPLDATGLSYLRARYYDPELGRLLTRDAWRGTPAAPLSLNRYAYVMDNPIRFNDPSGHCAIDVGADVVFVTWDLLSLAFGPEKDRAATWLALGADAGAFFIPCVTGAGLFIRAGRFADDALDANKLHHIFDRAEHGLDPLVQAFGGSQEAAFRAVEGANRPS